MQSDNIQSWQHKHTFGQDAKRPGESRTLLVIALTAAMMVIEIGAGLAFGSMALLADGLHMGSHTAALTITAFAYIYTRRHATDERFSFGAGKVNALAGFTGALLLALFALMMTWESVGRMLSPVGIAFNQAIAVAVVGLVVNGLSLALLGHHHGEGDHNHHHHDHNLRAAYLHVLADALTSFLAIFALLAGKYFGLVWMDPLMGIVGAVLVARWSMGLLRTTSGVLLDRQAPAGIRDTIRNAVEQDSDAEVADLHVWSVGPGINSAILSVVTSRPHPPEHYKQLLPQHAKLVHCTVEVHERKQL